MMKANTNTQQQNDTHTPKGGNIYTLVQKGTSTHYNPPVLVTGKGTDISDRSVLKKLAKKKVLSQNTVLNLIKVCEANEQHERLKPYWNTYHCQDEVYTAGDRLYGKYCKNRFCNTCNSIRKATLINKYLPIVQQWPEPYFVTLTVKSCSQKRLKLMVDKVLQGFQRIKDKHRQRHRREKGIKLIGLKSLECNFNPQKRTYNPHLHLIVPDKETAEILIREWLNLWGKKYAVKYAQDMRKVSNPESCLIEIIKYGSKIFTEWDTSKAQDDKEYKLYAAALNNIFAAMKGRRIFDRFGFNAPKVFDKVNKQPARLMSVKTWVHESGLSDWLNEGTKERLSKYITPMDMEYFIKNNIDCDIN